MLKIHFPSIVGFPFENSNVPDGNMMSHAGERAIVGATHNAREDGYGYVLIGKGKRCEDPAEDSEHEAEAANGRGPKSKVPRSNLKILILPSCRMSRRQFCWTDAVHPSPILSRGVEHGA